MALPAPSLAFVPRLARLVSPPGASHSLLLGALLLGGLLLGALSGCGEGDVTACQVAADCPSGLCQSDGKCAASADANQADGIRFGGNDAAAGDGSTATSDAAPAKDGLGADAQPASDAKADGQTNPADAAGNDAQGPDAAPSDVPSGGACLPNHDGILARSEISIVPGLKAKWLAAADAVVDLKGEVQADGSRNWAFDGKQAKDAEVAVETLDPKGAWWAKDFAGADYAARLAAGSDLLGVFTWTDKALLLRGVVSPTSGFQQTKLTYDPPVPLLQFPMQQGSQWTAKATVAGQAQGFFTTYTETYSVQVDASGQAKTPFGTFPVLRARVELDRLLGFVTSHRRSFLFLSECFGTVVTADSAFGESAVEFTKAAELRRLAP